MMDRSAWKALPRAERTARKREMRKAMLANPTPAEARLLEIATQLAPKGRWRAQVPVCGYIADVASHRLRIVLEADGGAHLSPEMVERDRLRDTHMRRQGWNVLRFTNPAIISDDVRYVEESVEKAVDASLERRAEFTLKQQRVITALSGMEDALRRRVIEAAEKRVMDSVGLEIGAATCAVSEE